MLVANARQLRLIYKSDNKSDKADAEYLARMDPKLLRPIKHRGDKVRFALATVRSRHALVRARTQFVNHVRGTVKSTGARIPSCSTPAFCQKALKSLPTELQPALMPVLETIAQLSEKINELDRKIEQMCRKTFPETELLQQIKGVGPVTALTFVLVVEDPKRFKKSRTVGAYVGLVPKTYESGACNPQLRITKAGDKLLRQLLVGSAQYILGRLGPDSDLQRHGAVIATRGGKNAKKRAVVAVARKLAVLLHRLWITGEVYEPLHNSSLKEPRRTRASA